MCFLDESAATQTLVLNGDTEERDSIEDDPFTASNMEVCMYIHHSQECITYPTVMYVHHRLHIRTPDSENFTRLFSDITLDIMTNIPAVASLL